MQKEILIRAYANARKTKNIQVTVSFSSTMQIHKKQKLINSFTHPIEIFNFYILR